MSNHTASKADSPRVSIIIVNWNGKKWLADCFDSLRAQTFASFETILVDNASTDDSVAFTEKAYPEVRIVRSPDNSGFAKGNVLGYRESRGEYVLMLNNDTKVVPDFLEKMVQAFSDIPNLGSVQSKLILMNDTDHLDVCGSYWTSSSFLYHVGFGAPADSELANTSAPYFTNKGASMMLPRAAIEKIGFLDEDFWCYYEETDICNRLWLAGYECWYYPQAVAYHAMGGTSLTFPNSFIQFHNFKNKLLSFLKNFQGRTLVGVIPVYLAINVGLSLFWLVKGKARHSAALYQAIWWNVVHLPGTLRKRKQIQALRTRSDAEIFRVVKRNPALGYYRTLLGG